MSAFRYERELFSKPFPRNLLLAIFYKPCASRMLLFLHKHHVFLSFLEQNKHIKPIYSVLPGTTNSIKISDSHTLTQSLRRQSRMNVLSSCLVPRMLLFLHKRHVLLSFLEQNEHIKPIYSVLPGTTNSIKISDSHTLT